MPRLVGDALGAPVDLGAVVVPALEHGHGGHVHLLDGVVGELLAGVLAQDLLEAHREVAQVVGSEVGVELGAHLGLLLGECILERLRLHAHDHVAEHAYEAAVGVVGEARVVGQLDHALDGLVVQAQVEDGIHHARHGEHCAGAYREQQWVLGIAQRLAGQLLESAQMIFHLLLEAIGILAIGGVVDARSGGHGEALGHGDAQAGHLRQVGALAPQEGLHRGVTLGEIVYVLGRTHQPGSLRVCSICCDFLPSPKDLV